mmetsp:Transcript_3645/g.6507  ORF Transcript_3645/g.6507 Transcript_3645/m.6507 type:complete len:293 (-) Transcript_3645:19-897(-)
MPRLAETLAHGSLDVSDLSVVSSVRARSKSSAFLSMADPQVDQPLRIGVCDGVLGNQNIHVTVSADNRRALILDGKTTDGFIQSEVRCKGTPEMLFGSCDDKVIQRKWKCNELDFSNTLHGDAFPYVAAILRKVLPRCKRKPLEILMLGLGGGTMQSFIANECPHAKVTTVETSPGVLEAAHRFFGFKGKAVTQTAQEAMTQFVSDGRRFDVVVVDIADTVLDDKDVQHLHTLLKSHGLVLQNHTNVTKMAQQLPIFHKLFLNVAEESFGSGNVVVTSSDSQIPDVEQALTQ